MALSLWTLCNRQYGRIASKGITPLEVKGVLSGVRGGG